MLSNYLVYFSIKKINKIVCVIRCPIGHIWLYLCTMCSFIPNRNKFAQS